MVRRGMESLYEYILRTRISLYGLSDCRILGGPRVLPADFSILQARTAVSLFVGLSNYWEGPAILVLLLAISRKGPLKCLLGGPRSRGVRFLGPSYRRRRPRPPISLDFSGLGWFWGGPAWAQGWAQTGSVVGPRVVLKWFWDRARTPEPPEPARGPTNSPFGAYNNMTVGGVWGLGRG